jgi:hypothetical protein
MSAGAVTWVRCPVCGEHDMQRTEDGDEGHGIIVCTNLNCFSNGGTNRDGIEPTGTLEKANKERDDADRRAGAAERRLEYVSDTVRCHERWSREAKEAAGYHHNVSFDVVWAEALASLIEKRGKRPLDLTKWKDAPKLREIRPNSCDHRNVDSKWEWMRGGDGSLYWATATHYAPEVPMNKQPDWATHVVYFGK